MPKRWPQLISSLPVRSFWLCLLSLLLIALSSTPAFAENRTQLIENLSNWAEKTAARQDLDAYEKDLRVNLIHRLIFQTERKFHSNDWAEFLRLNLEEMSLVEEEPTRSFLLNLKDAFSEVFEVRENSLRFIQAFMEFSGIREPAAPEAFAASRNYSDGNQMQSAHPVSLDEAGDFLEEKERQKLEKSFFLEPPEELENEMRELQNFNGWNQNLSS